MCLDAAVMGTCPTFINQSWKKKGNSVKGGGESGERGCRVSRRGREEGGGAEQGSY